MLVLVVIGASQKWFWLVQVGNPGRELCLISSEGSHDDSCDPLYCWDPGKHAPGAGIRSPATKKKTAFFSVKFGKGPQHVVFNG